ncbi:class I adenylate-forming enzyme family protein [Streptomyces scopuliridis]|uniref:class I adenylate-forming enzyme family protein n=1 Tax=Streptomyces scopuliridis TaxID=452529 RepID=UPI003699D6D0
MTENVRWTEVLCVGDLLVRAAHRHPEVDALVLPDARYTYAELYERAEWTARGLVALGIRPGEHVGLLASNGVEFAEGLFAIALIGGVVVPLNARHKATELGYIIDNSDLAAVLTTAGTDLYVDFTTVLKEALPSLATAKDSTRLSLPEARGLRAAVLLCGADRAGFLDRSAFDRLAADVDPRRIPELRRRVRIRDIAALLYTSGTTANPKGCLLSHEAMTRGPVERARFRLGSGDRDVTWAAGPLFHIAALSPFLGSVGSGGTFLTDVHYEPDRARDLLVREGATVAFPWFPAIIQPLLDHPAFEAAELQALRSIFLIGPSVLLERVQSVLPEAELIAACGMTETAGIYAISDWNDSIETRATAQGKPYSGMEIRILDLETGEDAEVGVIGELLVRGFCVTEGYYHDPEATSAAFDEERWLHTGDLYSWTPEGQVAFHGRLKDMLKVGGENVAALEIESFLARHPAVRCVEVVGAPDPRLDEVPVAFVEVRDGCTVTAEELMRFCRGRIASFKIPRAVRFIEPGGWPMSTTKINKRALRRMLNETESELTHQ